MVGRNPTAQYITLANRHFLIDCGEGTQVQLRKNHIGFGRINHIFISHLHGDHFYGLLPLLSTLHLLDRHKEIHIYCPEPLKEIIECQMRLSEAGFRFKMVYHFLQPNKKHLCWEDNKVQVHSFPVKHSIKCWGFLFSEKPRERNMKSAALKQYNIPVAEIRQIKKGANWVDEKGNTIKNEDLTTKGPPPLSYAYCTDTAPIADLHQHVFQPNVLYHESTFTEEHKLRAKQTKHSTAKQAAEVAKSIEAKHLLLGHYSTRYQDLNPLLQEAKEVFAASVLSKENHVYRIKAGTDSLIEKPCVAKLTETEPNA